MKILGFEQVVGHKPVAGVDFDPDDTFCRDDYEYFTSTGLYDGTHDDVEVIQDAKEAIYESAMQDQWEVANGGTPQPSEGDEILQHLLCFVDGQPLWDSEEMAVLNSNADAVRPFADPDTGEIYGYLG